MSYQIIARKWRPQTFDDLVGQQHVTETLKNAIKNDRVAHAYIFSGARGGGKTTAARILAKALNWVRGPTAQPCGECDSCKDIAAGTSLDVIEIDAASNRGIDQIRELREMVRYAPAASRSKVVILDEAHMLTGEASNALLKTLEEPPDRVIFVMATTQPEDLVDTIRSMSQHFHFRALTFGTIAARRFPTKRCANCWAWCRMMRWRNWSERFQEDRRTARWGWCTRSRRKGATCNTSAGKRSGTCAIC